jgi:hypothetical protein
MTRRTIAISDMRGSSAALSSLLAAIRARPDVPSPCPLVEPQRITGDLWGIVPKNQCPRGPDEVLRGVDDLGWLPALVRDMSGRSRFRAIGLTRPPDAGLILAATGPSPRHENTNFVLCHPASGWENG